LRDHFGDGHQRWKPKGEKEEMIYNIYICYIYVIYLYIVLGCDHQHRSGVPTVCVITVVMVLSSGSLKVRKKNEV